MEHYTYTKLDFNNFGVVQCVVDVVEKKQNMVL